MFRKCEAFTRTNVQELPCIGIKNVLVSPFKRELFTEIEVQDPSCVGDKKLSGCHHGGCIHRLAALCNAEAVQVWSS